MKRIQKATVKQPNRLQAPRRSSLSSLKLPKDGSSRRILRKVVRTTELPGGDIANQPKLPVGYYVYTISVAGVVRYIGKGKGQRLYSHMKEVRSRLKRDFRLRSIGRMQRNLTKALLSGAQVIEQVLIDGLTEKEAYKLEYDSENMFSPASAISFGMRSPRAFKHHRKFEHTLSASNEI